MFWNSIIIYVASVLLQGKHVGVPLFRRTLFSGGVPWLNKVCESSPVLLLVAGNSRRIKNNNNNKQTNKTKQLKTQQRPFSQVEFFHNVFTYLGRKISIPIYSELYITIVNVCCNIYFKNSDFLMTVVKLLNSKLQECKFWANQSELGKHRKARESQEQSVKRAGKSRVNPFTEFSKHYLIGFENKVFALIGKGQMHELHGLF